MDKAKVYIVVLNWNGTKDTIACLKSLQRISYPNYQIILVDNGSEKEEYLALKQWCDSVFNATTVYKKEQAESGGEAEPEKTFIKKQKNSLIIIENGENLGFAAGNNVALRYILSKQEESGFTLLLNNDTEIESDFLNSLVEFMQKYPDYVACTPRISLFGDKQKVWNCGGHIKWYGNRKYDYAYADMANVPEKGHCDITFITGCALLFKPQVTGILSEQFFFGEEDFEFSLRMKKQEMKMAAVYDALIYHKVGTSLSNQSSLNKLFLFYACRLINQKNYYYGAYALVVKIINVLALQRLLILRHRVGIKRNLYFTKQLFHFIQNNHIVDKEQFEWVMSRQF